MTLAESNYQKHCDRYSDIHEHLPTLYKYASECDHVTEMGVREAPKPQNPIRFKLMF